jgi:hypothetical protein
MKSANEKAEINKCRRGNLSGSIMYLQRALREKYGARADTSTGGATLYISHDKVELADRKSALIAETVEDATRALF